MLLSFSLFLATALADENYLGPGPMKVFRASGEHQCWSDSSIGHSCSVSGTGYSSCDDAMRSLAGSDCCPYTTHKGRSNSFRLTGCTGI
jgi:hypothetical protein